MLTRIVTLALVAGSCVLHADILPEVDIVSLEESFFHQAKKGFSQTELKFCSAIEDFERLDEIESFEDFCHASRLLYDDFKDIVSQSVEGERLHSAALLRRDLLAVTLDYQEGSVDDFLQAMQAISEDFLRPFASRKHVSGLLLREEIYQNILCNPKAFDEFKTYVLLMDDDPLVVLGKTEVKDFQILGVESTDEIGSYIHVKYKYERDFAVYECECGF